MYTADVEWQSHGGWYVSFTERDQLSTIENMATISQLTPGTMYTFSVSAIASNEEKGEEIVISTVTAEGTGGSQHYCFK